MRSAVAFLVVAALAVGAVLLYPTEVPDELTLPPVDVDAVFGAEHVEESQRFERFLYADWVLKQIAILAALVWYARRGAAFARESAAGPIGTGTFLGMLGLGIVWLVGLPFGLAAHWWERRHDLTDLDYLAWLFSDWTTLAIEFLAITLALVFVMGLARKLGEHWWLPGAGAFVAVAALFTLLAPYVDTTEPLRDTRLLEAADRYEQELGLSDVPVHVADVGDETKQANAYAYGLGPTRRVVLWDTLLREPFEPAEQQVVLAHELAHHSQEHLPKGLGWFAIFAVPGAWILVQSTRGRGGMGVPEAVPLALVVAFVFQLATAPAANWVFRRMEAEADWKALEVTRDPESVEGVMVDLSRTSLGDPDPPAWVEHLLGTHPELADRVAMAHAWAARNTGG